MRLAASLFLATALTAPSVALASGASLRSDLAALDVALSWSEEREAGELVALSDPVIRGDRVQIEAEHLLYDRSTGEVTLADARFIDRRGANGTTASAGEMVADSPQAFRVVNKTEVCAPGHDGEFNPATIELRGFTVIPDPEVDGRMGAESFAMERLTVRMRVADDQSCVTLDEASILGVTSKSPGGDTATIETISMRSDMDGDSTAAFDFEMRNLTAFDPAGRTVASLGRMAVSTNVTGDFPETLPRDPRRAIDLLLRASGTVDLEISELFAEAPEELGGQTFRGHVVARLHSDDDAIDAELDIDISGLARLRLDLGLQVLPEGETANLSAMLGDIPGLAAAERLAVTRLHLSAADQGAVDIAEQTTGMGREDILTQLRGRLAVVPPPLIEPTMSFAEAVLDGGAGFRAQPAEPVALTQIMVTGMLQPNLLGSILAIVPE
jgi:hypothetical protein